jgi:transglutaminase-like putative cysteine protease
MQSTQARKPLTQLVDDYLRSRFTYIGETIETLVAPDYMLTGLQMNNRLAGDCDDITMLHAALLTCLDFKVRFVAIRSTYNDPNFDHVFLEVFDNGEWIPFDITIPLGTEIEFFGRLQMAV